ncbi:MAG TPA: hypothetical protein VKZ94_06230 [Advenella sp.]|nr:hypothetical protein [Advenella sp.]
MRSYNAMARADYGLGAGWRADRIRRMQAERFSERDLPQTRPLAIAELFYGNMMAAPPGKEKRLVSQPIVGRADIQPYARWLRETTGFELQPGQVW